MKDGVHGNIINIYKGLDAAEALKKLYQVHQENPDDKGGIRKVLPNGEIGDKLVDFN